MTAFAPRVFDDRTCQLGEGPTMVGQRLYWVDILSKKALWRDYETGDVGEISTDSHVSFVLPGKDGAVILGTVEGPVIRYPDGTTQQLPQRTKPSSVPVRWNDAKRGPSGEIWMGTSAYGAEGASTSLYRLSNDYRTLTLEIDSLGLANGMDWSPDGKYFYLIDTEALVLKRFDYSDGQISNGQDVMRFDSDTHGYPDGMTVDSEGSLWIAFWNGACVRRYSSDFHELLTIDMPTQFVTSCTFGGKDLQQLFITTSRGDGPWSDESAHAGMTFVVETDVRGKPPYFSSTLIS